MANNPASPLSRITYDSLLTPTIANWEMYLDDQGKSIHTVKAFSADLRLLASFLPPDRTLGEITTVELNNFLNWIQSGRGVPCSPKTLSRRITSIKAFFRWLHKFGVILIDPAEKVVQKSVTSPLPVVLTLDEVDRVYESALSYRTHEKPDTRYYVLFSLLINTAIKKGECSAISQYHIDVEDPENAKLFIRYSSPHYRYKERILSLPENWVAAYQEYLNQYDVTERVFPWSPRRLEYLLEDLSVDSKLDKHVSFDMCRWTSALIDYTGGIEHDRIRQKLGISKIQWREVRNKLEKLSKDW